jgi:hypothetical protein
MPGRVSGVSGHFVLFCNTVLDLGKKYFFTNPLFTTRTSRSTRGVTSKYDEITTGAECDMSNLYQWVQPTFHPPPDYLSGGDSARVAGYSTPTLPC